MHEEKLHLSRQDSFQYPLEGYAKDAKRFNRLEAAHLSPSTPTFQAIVLLGALGVLAAN